MALTLVKLFLFIFFLLSFQSLATSNTLELAQTPLGTKFFCAHTALKKAYGKLNIDLSYVTLPSKRALKVSNDGTVDGEMLRVQNLEHEYPNLIRIPVPLCLVETTLIARDKVVANKFEDLSKYRFGIVAGFVQQERKVKEYQLDAIRVTENYKLLSMMLLDRVDVIFLSKKSSLELINNDQKIKFKYLNFFKQQVYLYHYLHKSHHKIVPLITKELKKMEINGEIDVYAHPI